MPTGPEHPGVVPGPAVEVVVVAYGAPDLVRAALAPLAGAFPLTVVDNSASPGVRAAAEESGARYLAPERNGGFAAGVNHALGRRQHPGADVLLLNPDAVIRPADVLALHRALHADPALASVGPVQVDGAGVRARVAWPFPTPLAAWLEVFGLGRLRRREDFVIGSVLLLRAEALADVGDFDERFFLYSEETDWAYRAHRRGWRHAVVPGARATHLGAATSPDPVRRQTHFHAAQERYVRKHYGAGGWAVTRAGVLAASALRAALPPRDRARDARLRLRLYLRGPLAAESMLPAADHRAGSAVSGQEAAGMRIVSIAPEIAPGSGVAGVAYNLERQWQARGIPTERFTMHEARGDWLPAIVPGVRGKLALLARVIWFSTVGTLLARRYLAARPDAVSLCHNDALCGDVYLNHGLLLDAMRARGHYAWRMVRNPVHLFSAVRDGFRYSSRVHRVVVNLTEHERDTLRRLYPHLRARPVVIGNGVDTERFRPATAAERRAARAAVSPDGPLPDDVFCLLFVGHEFSRKGLPLVIEALAATPEQVHLLVVGGTPQLIAPARAQAQRLRVGERVHFAGTLADPFPAFAAADAFTLPSAYEANALVVLEALATGLPVLVTPVGYAPDIVDGRNGFLVERTVEALRAGILDLLTADRTTMAEAARASALGHAWSLVAQRYLDLFAELRGGSPVPSARVPSTPVPRSGSEQGAQLGQQ